MLYFVIVARRSMHELPFGGRQDDLAKVPLPAIVDTPAMEVVSLVHATGMALSGGDLGEEHAFRRRLIVLDAPWMEGAICLPREGVWATGADPNDSCPTPEFPKNQTKFRKFCSLCSPIEQMM